MPWPQTGATPYHAQLGFPDKGGAIKGLVVCNSWDLEPWDLLKWSGPELLSTVPWGMTHMYVSWFNKSDFFYWNLSHQQRVKCVSISFLRIVWHWYDKVWFQRCTLVLVWWHRSGSRDELCFEVQLRVVSRKDFILLLGYWNIINNIEA